MTERERPASVFMDQQPVDWTDFNDEQSGSWDEFLSFLLFIYSTDLQQIRQTKIYKGFRARRKAKETEKQHRLRYHKSS